MKKFRAIMMLLFADHWVVTICNKAPTVKIKPSGGQEITSQGALFTSKDIIDE